MKSLSSKIVSSVFWAGIESGGRQFALLLVFILLSRYLGPEALGLAALSMSLPFFLSLPLQQGIPDALMQGKHIEIIHFDSAFWLITGIGALSSLAIFLLAGPFAAFMGIPELKALVEWTSLIVVIRAIAIVPTAYLKKQLEFRVFALRGLVGTLAGGSVGIFMAAAGYGIWSLIGLQLAKSVAETLLLLSRGGWLPRLRFDYSRCKELFGFSFRLSGTTLLYLVSDEMPKIALGFFADPAAVGIYALARRILEFLTEFFFRPLLSVVVPAVSRMQDDVEKLGEFHHQAIFAASLVGLPACIGFASVAPLAVPYVFGQHWDVAVVSAQLIMLLGIQRITDINSLIIFTLGHTALTLKMMAGYVLIETLALLFAARHGAEATIIAIGGVSLLFFPIVLHYLQRVSGIDITRSLRIVPRLALAALVMAASVRALETLLAPVLPGLAVLGLSIVVGAIVYGLGLYLLLLGELQAVRQLIGRLREGKRQPVPEPAVAE